MRKSLNIDEQLSSDGRRQVLTTILVFTILFTFVALVRLSLVGEFTVGILFSLFFASLYFAVLKGFPHKLAASILLIVLISQIGYLGYMSGGITGNTLLVAPVGAVLATLIIGPVSGVITAFIITIIILTLFTAEVRGFILPVPPIDPQGQLIIRTIIFLAVTYVLTAICCYYSIQAKRLRKKIWDMATQDYLTGTVNRREIDAKLAKLIKLADRSESKLSLILLDIDHFKKFNDSFGHLAGDLCLKAVAEVIKKQAGRITDIVGRYGGEEFVVILPATDIKGATQIANNILEGIHMIDLKPHIEQASPISATLGVVETDSEIDTSPEKLMNRADQALYEGKQNGRDQVIAAGFFD